VPLRIAFDMDGVLADMHAALTVEAERLFATPGDSAPLDSARGALTLRQAQSHPEHGRGVRDSRGAATALEGALERPEASPAGVGLPGSPHSHLTSGQIDQLWHHVAHINNFWEGLQEIEPGAVARLARLAGERRWEVLFLTQRPPTAGATVQQQTQRWLQRHGFDLPSVYTTRRSRGLIAAALDLDVVVDDRFDGCVDVAGESKALAVLVWGAPDVAIPARVGRLGITVVPSVNKCLDMLEGLDAAHGSARGLMSRLKHALRLK
jgi:hypothetical protein